MKNTHIIETEQAYLRSFAKQEERKGILIYKDDLISDMYSHNLMYLNKRISKEEYRVFIETAMDEAKRCGTDFINLLFDFDIEGVEAIVEEFKGEQTTYAYFMYPLQQIHSLQCRQDCHIEKMTKCSEKEALEFDVYVNGDELGPNFTKRRFDRRSKVYLEEGAVDHYLCYHNNEIVGQCDLFIDGNVAKIEDFDVAAKMQRQGFGTAILKALIQFAVKSGAEIVYLITDEDDTAKEMYEKCGLIKVGEKTEHTYHF